MTQIAGSARMGSWAGAVALAIAMASLGPILLEQSAAAGEVETGEAELRAFWQGRYRKLRHEEARLVETVKLATKEYADANRRTYRRSGVRHFHRTNANEAKKELEAVRAEIAAMYEEASAAEVPIFWLDEVAEEPIGSGSVEGLGVYEDEGHFGGKGAYAGDGDESDESDEGDEDDADADADVDPEASDDGRNPLYSGEGDESGEDDEPASFEGDGTKTFDYEAWRANRSEYERKRAPEEHLVPDSNESPDEN